VDHPRAGKDEEQDDYLFGNKKEFVSAKLLMNGQTTAENMQVGGDLISFCVNLLLRNNVF
jgi:hypothetical protein